MATEPRRTDTVGIRKFKVVKRDGEWRVLTPSDRPATLFVRFTTVQQAYNFAALATVDLYRITAGVYRS